MSELTNKRLEQIANNERIPVTDPEIGDMARELLALRTLRDAGDEEVERSLMVLSHDYGIELEVYQDDDRRITLKVYADWEPEKDDYTKEFTGRSLSELFVQAAKCMEECQGESLASPHNPQEHPLRQQLREAREEIEKLNQIIRELKDNFGEMEVGA